MHDDILGIYDESGGGVNKMKRTFLLIFIVLALVACSKEDDVSPNDRFSTFTSYWSEQEFEKLYDMFSKETRSNFSKEDSIERFKKIYEDLSIKDIEITFDELSDEEIQALKEEENPSVVLPFTVEMESLAGPISFDYEATLVQEAISEEDDAESNWFVEWDAGFIHPELLDGGEISIEFVEPQRGDIIDRNQMPLAINDTVYEIGIKPEDLENREQSIKQIASILNMDEGKINEALDAAWVEDHLFVPITTILPTNEDTYNQLMAIPGVQRKELTGRIYPGGEATAHLVGYIGNVTADFLEKTDSDEYGPNDLVGRRGLEQLYEEQLKGKKGVTVSVRKEDGNEVTIAEKPVENGETIQLTIDINVQEKIFDGYGDNTGTTAAIDPKTGETLALVSAPSFDPNEILYGTSGNTWDKLENDPKQPLLNRFAASFAPGSVLKPITAAAGIHAGTLDPDETFEIEGLQWSKGEEWGNYKVTRVSESNGPVDLRDALLRSDNIYFAMQAVDMGSDVFTEEFKRFGFEEELPYEYPIAGSTLSNSGELTDEVLLANSSYGQGELEMSALHLATAYTMFLNEGNMLKPTLLLEEETGQIWKDELITKEDAKLIDDILRAVVTDGTAQQAKDANVPLAGKTGTVELKLTAEEGGSINSWFVGYPHDSQDILIAMMMEKTEDKPNGYTVEKFVEVINQLYSDQDDQDE